jgi:hypothetical protein
MTRRGAGQLFAMAFHQIAKSKRERCRFDGKQFRLALLGMRQYFC